MKNLTQREKNKLLRDIIQRNDVDDIEKIVKDGASLETGDDAGNTPLIFAAELGHSEACKKLIQCGAKIDAGNRDGYTALSYAALNGNNETCQVLLAAGANIEAETINKATPLIIAAYRGHADVCRTLIEHRANIEAQDDTGATAFDVALQQENKSEEVAKVLLSYGAIIRRDWHRYNHTVTLNCLFDEMQEAVEILFPTSRVPSRSQCFGDDGKLDERVLFACATHQFGPLIGGALLGAKQYTLFEKIWEALPQHWRDNNQGLYIEYGKLTKSITPPSTHSTDKGIAPC